MLGERGLVGASKVYKGYIMTTYGVFEVVGLGVRITPYSFRFWGSEGLRNEDHATSVSSTLIREGILVLGSRPYVTVIVESMCRIHLLWVNLAGMRWNMWCLRVTDLIRTARAVGLNWFLFHGPEPKLLQRLYTCGLYLRQLRNLGQLWGIPGSFGES